MAGKIALLIAAGVLSACTVGGVEWDNYPPNLQSIIDDAAERGDCAELQAMFDVWIEANQPGQRSTTDVATYINDKIEDRC